jgi:gliding motility-associated-like protein
MRINKYAFVFLFIFAWLNDTTAQRAMDCPSGGGSSWQIKRCAGTTYNTSAMCLSSSIPNLQPIGWYDSLGASLSSGNQAIPLTAPAGGTTRWWVFRSFTSSAPGDTTRYYDTLRIEGVGHPQIVSIETVLKVCSGEPFELKATANVHTEQITWINQTAGVNHTNGEIITITEPTTFQIIPRNAACDEANITYPRTLNVYVSDTIATNSMKISSPIKTKICEGCFRTFPELLAGFLINSDSLVIESATWTKNSSTIASNANIGAPATGATDSYIGSITGRLYITDECGILRTRQLTNEQVTIEITSCDVGFRWEESGTAILSALACKGHLFEIINPQREVLTFNINNIETVSGKNYPIEFLSGRNGTSGTMEYIYQFKYTPNDTDTLTITGTYTSACTPGPIPFEKKLFFRSNEIIDVNQSYCRGERITMTFSSESDLTIDSVVLGTRIDTLFELKIGIEQKWEFVSKDTVHKWDQKYNDSAIVYYSFCDVKKTGTYVIEPNYYPKCYPEVYVDYFACAGDTNYITIVENRLPNNTGTQDGIFDSIKWNLPYGIELVGSLDTFIFARPSAEYRQKFISYTPTSVPISYELYYTEGGMDTVIKRTLDQKVRSFAGCSPIVPALPSHCRGEENVLIITMQNVNGRIERIDFNPDNAGKIEYDFLKDTIYYLERTGEPKPVVDTVVAYYYTIRFEEPGKLNISITYNYGDSIRTVHDIKDIKFFDCNATLLQRDFTGKESINKTYCDGETAFFEVVPAKHCTDTILAIVWEPVAISEMTHDSIVEETGVWHFHSQLLRDTVFRAMVYGKNYFGNAFPPYMLLDSVKVRPFPKIWKEKIIDVCGRAQVNLNISPGGVSTYWDATFVINPNWQMPPFYTNFVVSLLEGDSIRGFPTQAQVRAEYQCASMGGNIVYDTVYLRWNNDPSVVIEPFPAEGICVNDTLTLSTSQVDMLGTITWLKGTDTLYKNRGPEEPLRDIVTESVRYTALNTTACGTARSWQDLIAIQAPEIKLSGQDSACLYDSVLLYIPPNANITGLPEWYIYDTMYTGDTVRLPIKNMSKILVTVLAKGGTNGCNGKDTILVTPKPLPTVRLHGSGGLTDTSSCVGIFMPFTLTVNGTAGLSYEWISPASFVGTPVALPTTNVGATDTTTIFRIQGTDPNTKCKNYGSYYISILEPDIHLEALEYQDTACERTTYQFAPEYFPNMQYSWQSNIGIPLQMQILRIENFSSANAGTYKLFRNWHGCKDESPLALSMKPTPVPKLLSDNPLELCENLTLELEAELIPDILQYWITPEDIEITGIIVNEDASADKHSGKWYFVVKQDGCADTLDVDVRVDTRISPEIKVDETYYCGGGSIQFAYFPNNSEFNYTLKLPTQTLSGLDPLLKNISRKDSGMAMLFVDHSACQDTGYIELDIRYSPNPQTDVKSNYCIGDDVLISVTQEDGVEYQWLNSANNEIGTDYYLEFLNIDKTISGHYSLIASINECETPYTFTIVVNDPPIVDLSPYDYLCIGDTLTMDVMMPDATYRWSTGEITPAIRITEGNRMYSVTVIQNNCPAETEKFIEGREKPIFKLPCDTSICLGSSMIIYAGIDDVYYRWKTNSEVISEEKFIDIHVAGLYELVTEFNACTWSDSIRITDKFCDVFEMPNAFRPDNPDFEINRIFKPTKTIPEGLVVFEMSIYDRWGKLMFQTKNPNIGWDGTDLNGKNVHPGVYVWVIKAHETLGGTDLSTKGTVTLVK